MVTFTIDIGQDSSIDIRWTDEYGPQGTPVHRWFADNLELIRGVNDVTVTRYAVRVRCEPRVRSLGEIWQELWATITEDPELLSYVRAVLKDPDAQIEVA